MRGVDHFIVYTTSDMSPALREVYEPYLDAGLASRVHYNMPSQRCWWHWSTDAQITLMMNDCLYRSRGHAKWLFPSLDVDEYLGGGFLRENVTRFLDRQANRGGGVVDSVYLRKVRFARVLNHTVEIASNRRSDGYEDGAKKYAAKVDLVRGVGIHWRSVGDGTLFTQLDPGVGKVHHYRHPTMKEVKSKALAMTQDDTLMAEVPKLEQALKQRLGQSWVELLTRWGEVNETPWTCEGRSGHGEATWKQGITNFDQSDVLMLNSEP